MQALVQIESTQWIVDIVLQADFHAADCLGYSLECSEVDHHEVVDRQPAERLHGLQHAPRPSVDHGFVEASLVAIDGLPVLGAVREHHQSVAGNADAHGLRPVGVDVEDHGGVAALDVAELLQAAVALVPFALARVAAHHHHRESRGFAGVLVDHDGLVFGHRGPGLLRDVECGDIPLELAHDGRDPSADHGCHQDGPRDHSGRDGRPQAYCAARGHRSPSCGESGLELAGRRVPSWYAGVVSAFVRRTRGTGGSDFRACR